MLGDVRKIRLELPSMHERVLVLQCHHGGDAEHGAGDSRLDEPVARVVRAAERSHRAIANEPIDRGKRLVELNGRVVDVQKEQVDRVDAQPLERLVHGSADCLRREPWVLGRLPDLGRDDDAIAIAACGDPRTDHCLAATARVRVSGVNERATTVDKRVEDAPRSTVVNTPPEDVGPEGHRVHPQV